MNDEALRRLVERTLELRGTRLQPGAVPDTVAIPRPANARLIGSVSRGPDDPPDQVTAYFDIPGTPDEIRSSFDRLFGDLGFTARTPAHPGLGGGFEHSMRPYGMPGQGAVYVAVEHGPFYTLGIAAGQPAAVTVGWHAGGGWHAYGAGSQHHGGSMEDLPSLSSPPGVLVQGGGGGGGPGAWYAHGIAFTDLEPHTLLDHYAQELEKSGCERLAREDAATACWGRWKMTVKDFETIVAVVAAHPSMRLLLRYTFSPRDQDRQKRMMTSGWSSVRIG